MTPIIKDLRLQLAEFNSLLLENYLLKIDRKFKYQEYQEYLFGSFYSLSEGLAALGAAFDKNDTLSPDLIISLKKVLTDAAEVTYLVEKSADVEDLNEMVRSLQSADLQNNIANIKIHGNEFTKGDDLASEEVAGLIEDNPGYFNKDGSLKYPTFTISTSDAAKYIAENSEIPQVKIVFKNLPTLLEYFDLILSDHSSKAINDKESVIVLSNTLTVVLIAFGYVEPFFEKDDSISDEFNQMIKTLSATQSSINNTFFY